MLVVSMADFNASPSKYTKKTFSIEEDGHKWIVRPVREPISKTFNLNVLTSFLVRLGLKRRPLGFLKGKAREFLYTLESYSWIIIMILFITEIPSYIVTPIVGWISQGMLMLISWIFGLFM